MKKITYAENLSLNLSEAEYKNLQRVKAEKESNSPKGHKFSRGVINTILGLYAKGYAPKEIAFALSVEESTVNKIIRKRSKFYHDYFTVRFDTGNHCC